MWVLQSMVNFLEITPNVWRLIDTKAPLVPSRKELKSFLLSLLSPAPTSDILVCSDHVGAIRQFSLSLRHHNI